MAKTFQQYLAEAQAKNPVAAKAPVKKGLDTSALPKFDLGSKNTAPQDPLSWLVDIASRPLYGMTNAVSSGADRAVKGAKQAASGDFAGALGTGVEQAVNTVPDILTGIFSNDKKHKHTTSDVIEQTTDKIGSLDPNYKDEQDNVNPVLKGVAGFIGDVALDPTTYIPGAAFVKAGGMIAKGAKATGLVKTTSRDLKATLLAEKAAKDIEQLPVGIGDGAKAVDNAASKADEALAEVNKIEAPTKASVHDAQVSKATEFNQAEYAKQIEALDDPSFLQHVDENMLKASQKEIDRGLAMPQARRAKSALDALDLTPDTIKSVVQGAANPRTMKAIDFMADTEEGTKGWVQEALDTMETLKLSEVPKVKIGGKDVPLSTILSKAAEGHAGAIKDAEMYYARAYLPQFAAAKKQGRLIDAIGRKIDPAKPGEQVVTTLMTSLGKFRQQVKAGKAQLEAEFGPQVVRALLSKKTPEGFERSVAELKGILDKSIDVHTMTRLSNPVEKMFEALGIDKSVIPLGIRQLNSGRNLTPPPATVAEAAAKMGGNSTPATVLGAERGLRHAIEKNILEPRHPELGWEFKTRTGVPRTADLFGDGEARRMREMNTYMQWDMVKADFTEVGALARQAGHGFGHTRSQFVSSEMRARQRLREAFLDDAGIPMTLGVGEGRVPLGIGQAWDILHASDRSQGQLTVMAALWNADTAIPTTALLDALEAAAKGADREQIIALIRQQTTRYAHADGSLREMPNNLLKGGRFGRETLDGDELVESLANVIEDARPALKRQVEANAKAYTARRADETLNMTDDELNLLEDVFVNRKGDGEILQAIYDSPERMMRKAGETGAMQVSLNTAHKLVDISIPTSDKIAARTAVGTAKIFEKASKTALADKKVTAAKAFDDVQEATKGIQQKAFDDLQIAEDFNPSGKTHDFGADMLAQQNTGFLSKMNQVFNRDAGNKLYHQDLVKSENIYRDITGRVAAQLNRASRKYGRETLTNGFRNLQNGIIASEPGLKAAQGEISDMVYRMFGGVSDSPALIDSKFFSNGANIHHLNSAMEYAGLEKYLFDVDKATSMATQNGTDIMTEAAKQWRTWQTDDAPDLINRMTNVLAQINAHQSIGQSFVKSARELGVSSFTPKPGYARITVTEGKRSIMAKYLPTDMYYDERVLDQLHVMDNIMQQSLNIKGDLGKFITNVYRPLQDMWKYGMTLVNPTHHIRNGVSDASLTFMALGMPRPGLYKDALSVMGTRNGYSDYDMIKALQGIGRVPEPGKVISTTRHGDLTAADLYSAGASRGNLPHFRTLENLEDDTLEGGKIKEKWQDFTNSRTSQVIGGVSEARDHYFRMAHFIQFTEKHGNDKAFKSMEELLDAASESTRKWHPDGSDLTVHEQAFRLVIPFYSWQRKAIPLVIESMLTHPARVMALPKASYAMAVAAGVNPESLSDPFPEDQMFPSYMTGQITGPVIKDAEGKYYGLNPGFATNDLLGDYVGANPLNTVLGSVSPFLRAPFELAAGANVGTGANINDTSDYLDSNIPIVGTASRMTGNSVTGSILSMLQGKGLDPQYQIAKGNKTQEGSSQTAILNWLTGAGLTPMSQENQINYAEIEKRNREAGKTGGF